MCKIGCNWSNALYKLIVNKQVEIDYIKTGAFGEFENQFPVMRSLKPVLLHGLECFVHAGMKNIEIVDFQKANRIIEACGSPHYGLHAAIYNSDMSQGMSDEDVHIHMCKQIQIFKHSLNVPLLLENIPDSPVERTENDHYPYVKPEQISRLLQENDVDLLLDLSHARITAVCRDWDIYDYLLALPLHHVKEIHVNGSGYNERGIPVDTHQAMEARDYELLAWVLEHTNPDIITLEYNGIKSENEELIADNLYSQLKKLEAVLKYPLALDIQS